MANLTRSLNRFNQRGQSLMSILLFSVIGVAALGAFFGINSAISQSWTGSGTVVERTYHPASKGTGTMLPMGSGGFIMMDDDIPESYQLTVRDDKGDNHSFRVNKEQYDSTAQGARFIKN